MNRELELVMRPLLGSGPVPGTPQGPGNPGAGWQRTALLPGQR